MANKLVNRFQFEIIMLYHDLLPPSEQVEVMLVVVGGWFGGGRCVNENRFVQHGN